MTISLDIKKKPCLDPDNFYVNLRLLKISDLKNVEKWVGDKYVIQHTFVVSNPQFFNQIYTSKNYAQKYLDILINDKKRTTFAIEVDGDHVGNIGLKSIEDGKKSAECFVEIGEAKWRGIGIGTIAMSKLLDYAFSQIALSIVRLEVLEFNAPAIKVYKRLGFKSHGETGWHCDEFGQYWRVIGMHIHDHQW